MTCWVWMEMRMQLWRPELELVGISSDSWCHCLPIRTCLWLWEEGCTVVVCEAACCVEVRPRGRPKRTWKEVVREDCQARKLTKEDAVDHCKWRKVIKEVRCPGWVWVGECFFWYRPTRVVPDKRPLNGCCCCCCTNVSLSAVLAAVPAWCLIW